jgi:hypothetical protein
MKCRRVLGGFALLIAATTGWACQDDAAPAASSGKCPPNDPATPDDESECKEIANVEAGAQAVRRRTCTNCHGANMAGTTTMIQGVPNTPLGDKVELYPPNLTSDPETGVGPPESGGKWTDDALALAIRTGVDKESQTLCPQMTHFAKMSDFEVYSIVKYLRSIPPVKNKIPRSVCPPLKTKDQQTLPR